MQTCGLKHDDVTFIVVFSACGHAGLFEESHNLWSFHESISIIYGFEPYFLVLWVFNWPSWSSQTVGRGRVAKLPNQNNKIIIPIYIAWCACRNYGNIDMGERLARTLTKVKGLFG